jgi:hypothetical protein
VLVLGWWLFQPYVLFLLLLVVVVLYCLCDAVL